MKTAGILSITFLLFLSIFIIAPSIVNASQELNHSPVSIEAEWNLVNTPTNENLRGVSILHSTVVWAVGDNGTILCWDGNYWHLIDSPTSADFMDVDFIDLNHGWAVGTGGTILFWNGNEWKEVTTPVSNTIYGIDMLSANDGWAVGEDAILHWNGSSWNLVSSPDPDIWLHDVEMVSSSNGWAVGSDFNIFHWNGSNWSVWLAAYPSNGYYLGLGMINSSAGWAVGDFGAIQHWNGSRWEYASGLDSSSPMLYAVDMTSSSDGWIVGEGGSILHYNGSKWSSSQSPVSSGVLFDIDMLFADEGWAVGTNGVTLRYGEGRNADLRQAGQIQISGNLVEGGKVFLRIPVKNHGNAVSPPIHPYTEGKTSMDKLWRADGAIPSEVTINPGETVEFTVQHDLWYGHTGEWTTYGVYLWNDYIDKYYGPLKSNSYEQQIKFNLNIDPKLKLLFVPLDWQGNQETFDAEVDSQMEFFLNDIPLGGCRDKVLIEKLDVTSQNYSEFTCVYPNDCGVSTIGPFVLDDLEIDPADYDIVIGLAETSPCQPIQGCSNGTDTVWVTSVEDSITAHEIGHIYGLEDEYCSNQAGSTDTRCNDGDSQEDGAATGDVNWLDADSSCECPPDGSDDSGGSACCNFDIGHDCSSVNYGVCCHGNRNSAGGRSTMSYANAQGPRGFDIHSIAHLNSIPELSCDSTESLTKYSGGMLISNASNKIIDVNILIYQDDTVVEQSIMTKLGEQTPASVLQSQSGAYVLEVIDANENVLWSHAFEIHFDYNGPVFLGEDYSGIDYEWVDVGYKIPFNITMNKINLYHGKNLIFSKQLPMQDGHTIYIPMILNRP